MQQSVLLKLGKATLLNLSSSRRRSRALSRCATLATIATSSTVTAESQFLNSTSPCSLDSLNMSSMLLSPGFWRSRQQQPQSRHSTRTLHTSTRVWGWGCWSSLLYCGCIVVGAAAAAIAAAAPFVLVSYVDFVDVLLIVEAAQRLSKMRLGYSAASAEKLQRLQAATENRSLIIWEETRPSRTTRVVVESAAAAPAAAPPPRERSNGLSCCCCAVLRVHDSTTLKGRTLTSTK